MQIRFLEKDRWAGHVLPMPDDVLTEHYRVESRRTEEGFFVRLCPEKLPAPRVRTPEAYGFPDRLYARLPKRKRVGKSGARSCSKRSPAMSGRSRFI